MPIWKIAPVSETPEVRLLQWRILQTDAGTRDFVGRNQADYNGRVSSAISTFDAKLFVGCTRSGRTYQLAGPNGFADVSQYVWDQWCVFNGVESYEDVTASFLNGGGHDNA